MSDLWTDLLACLDLAEQPPLDDDSVFEGRNQDGGVQRPAALGRGHREIRTAGGGSARRARQYRSIAAFEGQVGQLPYAAAKGGVVGMNLVAARDLAPAGIRVVTIAPGTISTPAYGKALDKLEAYWSPQVPFPKRMGRSDEYAKLAVSIVENDYLNGEVIRLDGALRFPPK